MDPRFFVTREELQDVRMDLKRMQSIQQHHAERLRMLEKRQADDAALKSVWTSPFPSALGGTPQHGPVQLPPNDVFDDFDEQNHSLLNSLHIGAAEEEPIRRGAASRANSVRFDESALQGANWANQAGRHAGEVGPTRPGSSLSGHHMMERSFSHKSDGRHSSTGLSVHSGVSGRASSLGLDTNFMVSGQGDDDSPLDVPGPPPGFFFLGSAPAIIRCWLNENFTPGGVLYAAVCSGSQKSTVEFSLIKELDLVDDVHRDLDGACRITLPVFLAEASVTQSNSRSSSPVPQLPSITTSFEVLGMEQPGATESRKGSIRVVIGSHTLRMHSADLLFSQNFMTLYGNDRDKLSVPFVRPEDEATFMHLTTTSLLPEKPKLNAAAPEFVSSEKTRKPAAHNSEEAVSQVADNEPKTTAGGDFQGPLSPTSPTSQPSKSTAITTPSESGAEGERQPAEQPEAPEPAGKDSHATPSESTRRESSTAIRTPWRLTASANGVESGARESALLSGYQPASRPSRMKVLRPNKSGNASARTGAAYEPAPPSRSSAESRRKTSSGGSNHAGNGTGTTIVRWGDVGSKRSLSTSNAVGSLGGGSGGNGTPQSASSEAGKPPSVLRSVNNPLGSASAFSWIGGNEPKAHTASAE